MRIGTTYVSGSCMPCQEAVTLFIGAEHQRYGQVGMKL